MLETYAADGRCRVQGDEGRRGAALLRGAPAAGARGSAADRRRHRTACAALVASARGAHFVLLAAHHERTRPCNLHSKATFTLI